MSSRIELIDKQVQQLENQIEILQQERYELIRERENEKRFQKLGNPIRKSQSQEMDEYNFNELLKSAADELRINELLKSAAQEV